MGIIEMLRQFLGMGVCILLFGLLPGIVIGAEFHRYFYKDED